MNGASLPNRIVLIGYRGTGKSSVGTLLARRLGYKCLDADHEIERLAGRSIKEIFEQETVQGFRNRETEVIRDLASHSGVVLALGGGAILREVNRQAIGKEGSFVIWLKASAERLHERIHADASTSTRRPNLTASGGLEEITRLLQQREPLYRQWADFQLDTEGQTLEAIVNTIHDRLNS